MKKYLILAATLVISLSALAQTSFAASSSNVKLALNNAYLKNNGAYAVVVKYVPNSRLALYVNDENPIYATANKQDWATFRDVKLANNSKISFGRVFNNGKKTYQKPVNYVRYASIASGVVAFVATNPAETATQEAQTKPATQTATASATSTPAPTNCANGTYVNSTGNTVCSPEAAASAPAGATARCSDGTYSFSQSHSGTCSHHGGVAEWL